MKNILSIILGITISTTSYAWEKFDGNKFFNQSGGSQPFASCAWGCPNAKPCCRNWTVNKIDYIKGEPYYDMTCDEWLPMQDYLKSRQKEECVKYEIVYLGNRYVNQCVEWKYFDPNVKIITEANTTDYIKNRCNPRYVDVVTE